MGASLMDRLADVTEADEAADGSKECALKNLEWQAAHGFGMGIVGMFELTALNCGATLSETEAVIARGRKTYETVGDAIWESR